MHDRVVGYLLSRAAELTVRDSYDWFLIVDRLSARDTQTYVEPDPNQASWPSSRAETRTFGNSFLMKASPSAQEPTGCSEIVLSPSRNTTL